MKYKNIIFDLDGTLLNTLKDLNTSINLMLNDLKFKKRSLNQTKNDIGDGIKMLVKRSLPNNVSEEIFNKGYLLFQDYYQKHCLDKTIPYKHVKEKLVELKNQGFTMAVVTNKYHERAKTVVEHFFPDFFDMIQGQNDNLKRKPNPDMVLYVIDSLHLKKEETIYIGDTEVDYLTATNSGLKSIILTSGYRSKKQLLKINKNLQLADNIKKIDKYLY